jgi:hypothetical protein
MKSMNRREGKKIAVMAAVIMGFMVIAFLPAASAGVTSFEIWPGTGRAGAVDTYDVLATTTGFNNLTITIPMGYAFVAPAYNGTEIARVDFWNTTRSEYYGLAIITSDNPPSTRVKVECKFAGFEASAIQNIDYSPGGETVVTSPFGPGDTSLVTLKMPTDTVNGSLTINATCLNFSIDDFMVDIHQFVRNPWNPGNYVFNANGKSATVEITRKVYLTRYRDAAWYIDTDGDLTSDWSFYFAFTATDKPVIGDINRDGTDDIAFFHQGAWYVNTTPSGGPPFLIDLSFWFGFDGETPVVGDINQDGVDDLARFKDGAWYVDITGDHMVDWSFWYGYAGDTPLVGDINQDGKDDLVYFHQGAWYVTTDTTAGPPFTPDLTFWYGYAGDKVAVGDFNHDEQGLDDIARFKDGAWYIDTNFDLTPDISLWYGFPGDTPLGGGELG